MIELIAFAAQALAMASTPPLNWSHERGYQAGAAAVEVLIDPRGRALRCDMGATVGDPVNVARICPLLLARRWQPARSSAGQPTYAVYRDVAKFTRGAVDNDPDGFVPTRSIEQVRLTHQIEDFTFSRPDAVKGASVQRTIQATVLVNESGLIAICDPASATGPGKLREAACTGLTGRKLKPQVDPAGLPVAYVTTVKVGFAEP